MRTDHAPRRGSGSDKRVPLLLAACLASCAADARPPESGTVTAMLGGWTARQPYEVLTESLSRFTSETGIPVRFTPSPRGKRYRLDRYLQWLGEGTPTPDIYEADVTEIGRLAEHMVDLRPYMADEPAQRVPSVMANYVIRGRLVAMPLYTDVGLLLYRDDLLRKHGYSGPPETWTQLAEMAQRIQAGERAAGRREFWGYAWPGARSDDLLCVALEIQASHGGGQLIEEDGTISVNNPGAARAFERLRSWVGTISPRGVAAFGPDDARNLWFSGDAAFLRSWPNAFASSQGEQSHVRGKVGATLLPSGGAGHFGTLGGWQLSVSKYSPHPTEAARFVRYLTSRDLQRYRAVTLAGLPPSLDLYDDPAVVAAHPYFPKVREALASGTVRRPAHLPAALYDQVTDAYVSAVHTILTGESTAPAALAALEKQLVALTGFRTGPPQEDRGGPGGRRSRSVSAPQLPPAHSATARPAARASQ